MSASLESIIAAALTTHWARSMCSEGDGFYIECRCGEVGHVESDVEDWEPANQWSAAHQARAVLDALGEAGTVEWGVKYGDVFPYESETEARRQLNFAQMDVPAVLVSRIAAGPWAVVE